MSQPNFDDVDALFQSQGASATIDQLIETLRACREYHKLFDALLLKKKFDMGLPLVQPTGFDDVPEAQQAEFEESYVNAAREVGELFLAADDIKQAWIYHRTIREPDKVARALEALDARREAGDETEELINIALYEGANPVKGLELMLRTHGTCNTITALDQHMQQLPPESRRKAVGLLVRELYGDLCHTIRHEVEQKLSAASAGETLRELIADRDWLFDEGNYHIDVSHLNSVVRFARFLDPTDAELQQAIELSEYGKRLAVQFQYPGDPPFDDFYLAHEQFFKALAEIDRDAALGYFRDKLENDPQPDDETMIAYVYTDLLIRCRRLPDALDVAARYLKNVDESSGFSFAQLCLQAGRLDALRQSARERDDLVGYTAALLQERSRSDDR